MKIALGVLAVSTAPHAAPAVRLLWRPVHGPLDQILTPLTLHMPNASVIPASAHGNALVRMNSRIHRLRATETVCHMSRAAHGPIDRPLAALTLRMP